MKLKKSDSEDSSSTEDKNPESLFDPGSFEKIVHGNPRVR